MSRRALIISISSDIGLALARAWKELGWEVAGTYRTAPQLDGCALSQLDLLDRESVDKLSCPNWDVVVLGPGDLEPIGNFDQVDFDSWEKSVQVNLVQQLRVVHHLLPQRNRKKTPTVMFFAGGGTNSAVLHYSAYTLSKIALIKMTELLAAEIADVRFVIVGPGCVKTKIHEPTLRLGKLAAPSSYERAVERLASDECTPMEDVVQCCTWLATTTCDAVSGRNFSVASDFWRNEELQQQLERDFDMYKLRRNQNNWSPQEACC